MKLTTQIKPLLTALFLLCITGLKAQVLVQSEVNKTKIVLGEQLRLRITVASPDHLPVKFVNTDSLPHFEKIDSSKIDTANTADGITLHQDFTITSFDSGRWSIPAFTVQVDDKVYTSDSIPVDVGYSPGGAPSEYHDIKDIAEVKSEINWLLWGSIAAGVILLVLLIIWLVRRRRKHPELKRYAHLSPLDEAMKLLDELEAENLSPKEKYTRLTYIFRIFLRRKLKMNSFGKTTYELLLKLEKTQLPREQYTRLAQTLRTCNLVKFAKYEPVTTEDKEHIAVIRTSVQSLNNEAQ